MGKSATRRMSDRERAEAWRKHRAGQGPKPPPRPPRPYELRKRAARMASKPSPAVSGGAAVAPPIDPVARHAERKDVARLRAEHAKLLELLQEERERNKFLSSVSKSAERTPAINRSEKSSGIREQVAIAVGSDWHVEEPVEPEKVEGLNEYNLEIADRRVKRFFQSTVDMVQHHRASRRFVIRDVVCALIGDLMTGHIHDELIESAALSPIETALWLKPRIISGLNFLLKELDLRSLHVPWCRGNHGRNSQKKKISTGAENSYEYLLGKMIESDFKDDKRVKFSTSTSEHQFVNVYDFTLGFTHGDQIGYSNGIGGISIPIYKALPMFDQARYADWRFLGHFHTFRDFGRAVVNGSLIGFNSFAYHIRAPYEPPQQIFTLLDASRGKNNVTPLWVEESVNLHTQRRLGKAG